MQLIIYDKTEKGRTEIATREYHLPSRMRSLLVLIDGKTNDAELIKTIAGLGLNLQSLQELLDQEFIQSISVEQTEPPKLLDDTLGPPNALEESPTISEMANDDDWDSSLEHLLVEDDDEVRFTRVDMMKRFLSDTAKEMLGVRGFFLQRKIQKAVCLQDLHELRRPYVTAILHAKGKDIAIELRDQFDQRLYSSFSEDDPIFLDN
jgi:hypothetical protein